MVEEYRITMISDVRQPHIAAFDKFLRIVHRNFGKSAGDSSLAIEDIRRLAGHMAPIQGALQGATRNRHLQFIGQLLEYARGQGIAIDRDVATSPFHTRRKIRIRELRSVPDRENVVRFFQMPVFTGCLRWNDIDTEGPEFFHRAEHFAPIPAHYLGARREEYCGLTVEEVVCDDGWPLLPAQAIGSVPYRSAPTGSAPIIATMVLEVDGLVRQSVTGA